MYVQVFTIYLVSLANSRESESEPAWANIKCGQPDRPSVSQSEIQAASTSTYVRTYLKSRNQKKNRSTLIAVWKAGNAGKFSLPGCRMLSQIAISSLGEVCFQICCSNIFCSLVTLWTIYSEENCHSEEETGEQPLSSCQHAEKTNLKLCSRVRKVFLVE